jgi:uncharacterized protein
MWPLLPLPETFELFLATVTIGAAALAAFPPGRWRTRLAWAAAAPASVTALGLLLWATPPLAGWGVFLSWHILILLAPFALSLVPCAALARLSTRTGAAARLPIGPPASGPAPAPLRSTRRDLLRGVAASIPLSTLGGGVCGLDGASAPQRIPLVPMRFPGLHPDLEGLRILQLSDLHLGAAMRAPDLEALLVRAAAHRPDLIVLTGDVADDLGELEEALRIVHRHRPRLGVFAALGNHEYLHDIRATRPIYERSAVPLLVDRGVTLRVGGAQLYLAGADDPIDKGDAALFLDQAVARCASGAPEDAFRLLLCHRPEGFLPAAKRGFHLTLSGHTHGGQVGLMGVSAFQALMPDRYLWGAYQRGGSRLYTTSGFGHWFPFRLGCPTEAPLIVLAR